MRYFNQFFCVFYLLSFSFMFGQRENENWTFGYNKWTFNHSTGNLTTSAFSYPPSVMAQYQGSATYSNPTTGQLLFYTDGFHIFNKNHKLMENGSGMFSSSPDYGIMAGGLVTGNGLSTLQPSVIIPHPRDNNLYYIFFNGNYTQKTWYTTGNGGEYDLNGNETVNFGLRYAIIDLSYNGGLGKVVSQDNFLLAMISSGLTTAPHSDGNSYWLIAQKDNKFYTYKVSNLGLEITPIISNAFNSPGIIKISPNGQHLFSGNVLYNFNNSTGEITSPNNFTSNSNENYEAVSTSYAEFSPNSKILYFITGFKCLCIYPSDKYGEIGIAMYNLETAELVGREIGGVAKFPLDDVASLQLAQNGKIYLTFSHHFSANYQSQNIIKVLKTWATIENPNNWNPITNPINNYFNFSDSRNMSMTFPQSIPNKSLCIDNLTITTPITSSKDFQVSNSITASSMINPELTVNFKANELFLNPGFEVSAHQESLFSAVIDPCTSASKNKESFGKDKRDVDEFKANIDLNLPILFPNPAETYLNVENIESILEWKLIDIYGQIVKSGNNNTSQSKIVINIKNLTSGIYYFNAVLKNGQLFKKTIIKK